MMETLRILSLAVFVNLCYAEEVPCNVSQTPQGIIYRVPEFQADGCDYHWDNASGHVLANQKGKMDDLVLNSSDRSVTITSCLSRLNYTRDCISEVLHCSPLNCTLREYSAEHIVPLTAILLEEYSRVFIQRGSLEPYGYSVLKWIPQHYWYIIISFSITALLVLLALLGCICSALLRRNSPPNNDNTEAL